VSRRFAILLPFAFAGLVCVGLIWANGRRDTQLGPARAEAKESAAAAVDGNAHVDPVCNMQVGTQIATTSAGTTWYFCTKRCRDRFTQQPEAYLGETCLVCRSEGQITHVEPSGVPAQWQDRTYHFCTRAHRDAFLAEPLDYFMHTMWGLPGWLYYASVAGILLVSFLLFEWRALRGDRKRGRAEPAGSEVPASASFAGMSPSRDDEPPRIDLFRSRWLRGLLVHPLFRFALRLGFVLAFVGIVGAGLFGNQLPSKNIAPLLTWTVWWGGLVWLVLYFGKLWCYVCPWDAIAEWSERLRLWGRRTSGLGLGLPWPRIMRNIWPATVLFIGLTWIELGFGVTLKPRVTAWLGLLILLLAFVSTFVFDRKSFCRYGCLVGRISGLYALFAPVELRVRDRDVCRGCRTHSCYKGNSRGDACPMFEYPATMQQNTYCIMCMECVKTCESDNVTLRARPWGADLFAHARPRSDEAYLALIMLSLSGFHGLTMTAVWRDVVAWIESSFSLGSTLAFTLGMVAIMIAPVLVYAALVGLSRWMSRARSTSYREYFVRYAYALLPIALFYHLAHNSEHLLMEGQKVVALASDPFGYEWNLLGTGGWALQPLASLPSLWFLQVALITTGHVFSLWAARRSAMALFPDNKAALRSQIPMLVAVVLFSVVSLWLLKQPMEMRTSAM
jgi:YHS domain-containing protein